MAEKWFEYNDFQGIRWAWNYQSGDVATYNHEMLANVTEYIHERNVTKSLLKWHKVKMLDPFLAKYGMLGEESKEFWH